MLGDRAYGTWEATRNGVRFVVKLFGAEFPPDWRYTLRVAAALREQGWPTPEPAEEPAVTADGAWVLFHRLPGSPRTPAARDRPAEERARGRLLAEFHAAAAATGITDQRDGFALPADVVNDPELERWLRLHEMARPDEAGPCGPAAMTRRNGSPTTPHPTRHAASSTATSRPGTCCSTVTG